ncbi:PREDICTED: uncharacterized protein LOC104772106 [Camelina sativa]|uniref:Uncharacterized protein LOC104772106 n=1 Tax=Camelina sativa TaxID=90675 RepID=A0ABM0Y3X9_CAMSA|nr:PREDICTED: uncharacterized protein LOC104772106 [Camelina sativa]
MILLYSFSKIELHAQCTHNAHVIRSKVNFSLSDDDSDKKTPVTKDSGKPELPPPYDPFSKTPAIEVPEDPKNLQDIFHKMRTEGFTNEAMKMFDALKVFMRLAGDARTLKDAKNYSLEMMGIGMSHNAATYSPVFEGRKEIDRLKE